MNASRMHAERHAAGDLIRLFDSAFGRTENTVLVRGDDEPVYLPAGADCPRNRVVFAHGFFASALHEIAHWCIAGRERRRRADYGYWYRPDGRNATEQAAFEPAELRPQAIEWAFSVAAGFPFQVSADNLAGAAIDRAAFQARIRQQLRCYRQYGFPPRAARFLAVLEAADRVRRTGPLRVARPGRQQA